jgi:HD superfamily phosphodiesterase
MNRIEVLRKYIDEVLLNMTDVVERRCAYVHLYGVAQSCALIALKHGENVELAVMAGMLHDIYSYARMDTADHARKSAALAREILAGLQITSDDETRIICDAINVHSDKELTHAPFDEVLKDADVFQSWLYNPLEEINTQAKKTRCRRVLAEFGIARDAGLTV